MPVTHRPSLQPSRQLHLQGRAGSAGPWVLPQTTGDHDHAGFTNTTLAAIATLSSSISYLSTSNAQTPPVYSKFAITPHIPRPSTPPTTFPPRLLWASRASNPLPKSIPIPTFSSSDHRAETLLQGPTMARLQIYSLWLGCRCALRSNGFWHPRRTSRA